MLLILRGTGVYYQMGRTDAISGPHSGKLTVS